MAGSSDTDDGPVSALALTPSAWTAPMVRMWAADEDFPAAVCEALEQHAVDGAALDAACASRTAVWMPSVAAAGGGDGVATGLLDRWSHLTTLTRHLRATSSATLLPSELAALEAGVPTALEALQRRLNDAERATFATRGDASSARQPAAKAPVPVVIELAGAAGEGSGGSDATARQLQAFVTNTFALNFDAAAADPIVDDDGDTDVDSDVNDAFGASGDVHAVESAADDDFAAAFEQDRERRVAEGRASGVGA